jgi:DNA-directed RNA polymerase specialized sigma24 family protein
MDILGADDCAELARRIHDGDRAAEARFARLYCDCVFAMALARTRDRRAARELMDDVLMAVILALRHGAVRDQRRLGGFVHGTAVNTINAYFRQRSRQPRTIALDRTLPSGDALDEREEDDRQRTVRAAMALLELLEDHVDALQHVDVVYHIVDATDPDPMHPAVARLLAGVRKVPRLLVINKVDRLRAGSTRNPLADGLKPGEIATRLGLASVAVRQRKCRALRAIVVSIDGGVANVKARGMLRR